MSSAITLKFSIYTAIQLSPTTYTVYGSGTDLSGLFSYLDVSIDHLIYTQNSVNLVTRFKITGNFDYGTTAWDDVGGGAPSNGLRFDVVHDDLADPNYDNDPTEAFPSGSIVALVNNSSLSDLSEIPSIFGSGIPESIITAIRNIDTRKIIDSGLGGGGGTFTSLSDVPGTYVGQGERIVAVNPGETALEFIDVVDGGGF